MYYFRDKGQVVNAGPIWDMDLGFNNEADLYSWESKWKSIQPVSYRKRVF